MYCLFIICRYILYAFARRASREFLLMRVLVILGKGLKERGADTESARAFGTLLLDDYKVPPPP